MELTIPYQWAALDLTTHENGALQFALPNDTTLIKYLFNQFRYNLSYQEVIEAIGEDEFKLLLTYYCTEFNKDC